MLLLMLLPHLFISVCHARPSPSSDVIGSDVISDDDDDEPNVFAVFERNDPLSGKIIDVKTSKNIFKNVKKREKNVTKIKKTFANVE